ncbi:MAG: energy transducer TonB [Polaromonas sp.]|nr:energy transducer TonB [Polaromonas sp.]
MNRSAAHTTAHTSPQAATAWQRLPRHTAIAAAVVLCHVGALYALQSGLLRRAAEVVIPVEVLAQFIEPAVPQVEPPPPPPVPRSKPQPTPSVSKPAPTPPLPPPPVPVAVADATPTAHSVTGTLAPQPPAPPMASPVAVAPVPAPPAPPAPPRIDLPSSQADYLNNRPPAYPALSKRLGEQGKVVVRVLIDVDGNASQAEVRTSSGFDRLDQTALKTVLGWKYLPGKVNGEPKAMWFNVPIHFVLEP